ncbi:hypothetical protein SAMN05216383_12019 [Prevotella sp. KH2C16]|nr:hypothetical protein SAMN05216383_12019 [Prevotella sp. KH2C16]
MQLVRILKELVEAKFVLKSELSGELNKSHVKRFEYVVNEDFIPSLAPTNGNNMLPTNGNNMLPTNGNNMLPTNGNNMLPINTNIRNTTIENNSPNGGLSANAFDCKNDKAKSKTKKEPTIVTKARNIFEPYFEKKTGEKYYWKVADAVQMKRLLNQLKFSRKSKGLPVSDDDLLSALQVFLDKISDNWILANLSVPNISSKYNELISQARKQKGQIGIILRDNTDEKYLNQKIKQWK